MNLHKKATEIFARIYALEENERFEFLEQECLGDEALRNEVLELLSFHDNEADEFDSQPITEPGISEKPMLDSWLVDGLPGFKVLDVLGTGGMGVVYLAQQENPQRKVAVKLMRVNSQDEYVRRFQAEANALGRLKHPGIAQIYQAGTVDTPHGQRSYIVMEHVDGPDLLEFANTKGLSSEDIAKLISGICDAVEEAHTEGVIHRDLKPANILIDRHADNRPKVLDFGVARVLGDDVQATTAAGSIVGTLSYMSPEQAEGRSSAIGRQSDVYSLGVIAYRLLAGRLPLELQDLTLPQALNVISKRDPQRLEEAAPHVPLDLALIVDKALSKELERRYESAAALAADLRRFLQHQPIAARRPSASYQIGKMIRRNRTLVASLAMTFLVLIAGIAISVFLLLQRDEALVREQSANQLAGARLEEATEARTDFERLADVRDLKNAVESANLLNPPRPARIQEFEVWIKKYSALVERIKVHRETITQLRAKALPYTEEQRLKDHANNLAKLESLIANIEMRAKQLENEPPGNERDNIIKFLDQARKERQELETLVKSQISWDFGPNIIDQWQHDVLMDLVFDLEAFAAKNGGTFHDIRRRLEVARTIHEKTVEAYGDLWADTVAAIKSSEKYNGFAMEPQVGLIPLGPDPKSGLQEFLHHETHVGPLPERGENGRFKVHGDTGIILVLLPPGSDWIGAQMDDPKKPNYDPSARNDEWYHEFQCESPYLMSKYEMTQGQWVRASADGVNPSYHGIGFMGGPMTEAVTGAHPVEMISLLMIKAMLVRVGLGLPSGDEWEYAARAGDDSVFGIGTTNVSTLSRFGNLAGLEAQGIFPESTPNLKDAYLVHSPVGSFEPNAFGMHDMIGNLIEWTRSKSNEVAHLAKGSNYMHSPSRARLAFNIMDTAKSLNSATGVRPIYPIQP